MVKNISIVILFSFLFLQANKGNCQKHSENSSVKDSTPIEDLDYKLTKQEFLNYYGTDDTAKAVINMFYRKRGMAGITYCLVPGGSCAVGEILVVLGGFGTVFTGLSLISGQGSSLLPVSFVLIVVGTILSTAGVLVYPIIATINRANYTRKKLLFALVERERGTKLPVEIIQNLKPTDF
jgi:hypothetical protein